MENNVNSIHILKPETRNQEPETGFLETGIVVFLAQGQARVKCHNTIYDCQLCGDLRAEQQAKLAVGDRVQVRYDGGYYTIEECLPRTSVLSRPDPQARHIERVIAANVDAAVLVASVKTPPLKAKLIDRFLIAAQRGGVTPVLCVNKLDLLKSYQEAEELAKVQPYAEIGVRVIPCSTTDGRGISELRETLAGKLCVFIGHSGVGKSSIINALDPTLQLRTNTLRKGDGKGRHTTTASSLYELAHDIHVIDTPGVREFGLCKIEAEELQWYFPEFADVAACRFNNCMHANEPGCGIMQAVRDGRIARARYESYRRLLGDIRPDIVFGAYETHDGSDMQQSPAENAFTCANCQELVIPEGAGTRHRNHCPRCLWSRHLDNTPGDRAAYCNGMMEPVAVWVRRGGEWALIHRCKECGAFSSNRIAADDNEMLLLSLAVRPLSMPPFPLEKLER